MSFNANINRFLSGSESSESNFRELTAIHGHCAPWADFIFRHQLSDSYFRCWNLRSHCGRAMIRLTLQVEAERFLRGLFRDFPFTPERISESALKSIKSRSGKRFLLLNLLMSNLYFPCLDLASCSMREVFFPPHGLSQPSAESKFKTARFINKKNMSGAWEKALWMCSTSEWDIFVQRKWSAETESRNPQTIISIAVIHHLNLTDAIHRPSARILFSSLGQHLNKFSSPSNEIRESARKSQPAIFPQSAVCAFMHASVV